MTESSISARISFALLQLQLLHLSKALVVVVAGQVLVQRAVSLLLGCF